MKRITLFSIGFSLALSGFALTASAEDIGTGLIKEDIGTGVMTMESSKTPPEDIGTGKKEDIGTGKTAPEDVGTGKFGSELTVYGLPWYKVFMLLGF